MNNAPKPISHQIKLNGLDISAVKLNKLLVAYNVINKVHDFDDANISFFVFTSDYKHFGEERDGKYNTLLWYDESFMEAIEIVNLI